MQPVPRRHVREGAPERAQHLLALRQVQKVHQRVDDGDGGAAVVVALGVRHDHALAVPAFGVAKFRRFL